RAGPAPGSRRGAGIRRNRWSARSPRRRLGVGGAGGVDVAGGGGAGERGQDPEAELLEQVAADAQPLTVRAARRPAPVMGESVVVVADRRIAPRGAAGGVTRS